MTRRLPVAVCVILLGLWGAHSAHAMMAVIPLDHLDRQFVLPLAQSLLSPEGRVSFDQRTHALVVVDREEAIARIRDMLARLDRPAPQLLVRARTRRPEERRQSGGSVYGQVSVPGGSVSVGGAAPDDGVQVALQDRGQSMSADGEQRIRVASGSAAIIMMGRDMPARAQPLEPCGAGQDCRSADGYHLSASSLEVTPELRGDQVFLRVATADASGGGRLSTAVTQLRLPLGQWVEVGAILSETDRSMAAILSRTDREAGAENGFWLRVDRVGR